MVFDAAWYRQHQRPLIAALNTPGLGRELRASLHLDQPGRVRSFRPDGYTVQRPDGTYVAELRTGPVFARQLRRLGRPLWQMAHWFDTHIANPWMPTLNLGFDTLTAHPDPDPEVNTVDGQTARLGVDQAFGTLCGAAGNFAIDNDADIYAYLEASATVNQFQQLRRDVLLFDTSTIGSLATLVSATLSLWGISKHNALGDTTLEIVTSSPFPTTSVQTTDYFSIFSFGTTSFGSLAYASFDGTDTVYSDIPINATGLGLINPMGFAKYGARLGWDLAGSFTGVWANPAATYFQFASADNASGTAKAPKLVVTFTLPAGLTWLPQVRGQGGRRTVVPSGTIH